MDIAVHFQGIEIHVQNQEIRVSFLLEVCQILA